MTQYITSLVLHTQHTVVLSFIHTHTQRHTHKDTHTDTHRDTHKETHTHRYPHTQTPILSGTVRMVWSPERETGEGTSVLVTISSEHRPNTRQQEEREVGTLRLTFLMSLPKVSL